MRELNVGQETMDKVAACFVKQNKSLPGPTEDLDPDTLKFSTQTILKNALHLQTNPQNTGCDSEERNSFYCDTKRQKFIKFLFIQNNTYN